MGFNGILLRLTTVASLVLVSDYEYLLVRYAYLDCVG